MSRITVAFLVAVTVASIAVTAVLATGDGNDKSQVVEVPGAPAWNGPGATPQEPSEGTGGERKRVLAPIESVSVVRTPGDLGFVARVKVGLPGGCALRDGSDLLRTGNDIQIKVYNTLPAGNVPCTMIYGTYGLSIDLGSAFAAWQTYHVDVNGKVSTLYID